jgi:hypothetical protein
MVSNKPLTKEEKEALVNYKILPESFAVEINYRHSKVGVAITFNRITIFTFPWINCMPHIEKCNEEALFNVVKSQVLAITKELLNNKIPPFIYRKLLELFSLATPDDVKYYMSHGPMWDSKIVSLLTRNERFALQKQLESANRYAETIAAETGRPQLFEVQQGWIEALRVASLGTTVQGLTWQTTIDIDENLRETELR